MTTLFNFDGSNGAFPDAGLTADANGNLFGITSQGGANDEGAVFEIKNIGTMAAPLYADSPIIVGSFNGSNDVYPCGEVTIDADGNLLGTTQAGGTADDGTVFEIANTGTVAAPNYASTPTTLVSFDSLGGYAPDAGLIADAKGDLFGTTLAGGVKGNGDGTVFEIKNTGTAATPIYASTPIIVASFNGLNGANPEDELNLDASGDLLGTTVYGGANDDGTVFEIKNTGTVAAPIYASTPITLVSFNGPDGANPFLAGLTADANGNLFGTTDQGGANDDGTVFEIKNTGTLAAPIYSSPLMTLISFDGSDGLQPAAGLTVDANGNLFGTTAYGGVNNDGTIFEIKNDGSLIAPVYASIPVTLVNFNGSDGACLSAGLTADANGNLLGTTYQGGATGDGTVFDISLTASVPTITGTIGGQMTTLEAPLQPFANVSIEDYNAGATDTLSITLSGAGGTLSGEGLSSRTNGVYALTGTASVITTELDALVFTPNAAWPNPSATTTFTLSDWSDAGSAPALDATTTVIDNDCLDGSSDSITMCAGSNLAVFGSNDSVAATTGDGIWVNSGTGETITGAGFTVYAAAGTGFTVGGASATGTTDTVSGSNATITLQASSHLQLHGASDSMTMGAGSNLAVYGSNDSVAATTGDGIWVNSGTGETITGAGFTVCAAAGTGFTVGGASATGTTDTVSGSNATIALQASSHLQLHGATDSVTMGAGSNLAVYGSNDSVAATTGDGIWVNSGTGETITGAGFAVYAAAGTGFTVGGASTTGTTDTVSGSNATITLQASSHLQLHGASDSITMGAGSTLAVNGSNDSVAATTGDGIWVNSGTGETITGAGFTVCAAAGTGFTVGGASTTGTTDTVSGSNATITLQASSHLQLHGASDSITMGAGSTLAVNGSNDSVAATTGDGIWVNSGTGETITGAGFTVCAAAGTGFTVGGASATGTTDTVSGSNATIALQASSHLQLHGASDSMTMDAGSNLAVYGSNDSVAATTGDGIWVNSGTGETITGAGFTVYAAAGTGFTIGGASTTGTTDTVSGSNATIALQASSHLQLHGASDSITMGAGSTLAVNGANDSVAATTGDGIWVNSGTGETITGAGFTVHAADDTGLTIQGADDVALPRLDDAITDAGSSTLFKIQASIGSLAIFGFGADTTGIVDLLNGVGGFATSSQAFAALRSDGSGGSLLSLGSGGAVDFIGVAPSSLHASNFKIG